eukprot:5500493-Prymnesium_polylepis.1
MQAVGMADVAPNCEPSPWAWAPRSGGTEREWLFVTFARPAFATSIEIYETSEAPFVSRVDVHTEAGEATTVFWGPDTTMCGGALTLTLLGHIL